MRIGKFVVSRPCYNKYWRCPGWAGPGVRTRRKNDFCAGGSLARVIDFTGHWKWKFHKCPKCGRWIAPYVIRYIDPLYWWSNIKYRLYRLREDWNARYHNKSN